MALRGSCLAPFPIGVMRFFSPIRLLALPLLAVFSVALHAAEESETRADYWQPLQDFEARLAFEAYGPPLPEDAEKARAETQLYADMVEYFDDVSDDEDMFGFVAEAYSVPVDVFRPSVMRVTGGGTGDVFDDDPLPMAMQSSSLYVDSIRPTFLPGPLLKPRQLGEVKLGEAQKQALFAPPPEPEVLPTEDMEAGEVPKAALLPPVSRTGMAGVAAPEPPRGINAPPKSEKTGITSVEEQQARIVGVKDQKGTAGTEAGQSALPAIPRNPDEETLFALKQAVKELGLEKELNFEGNPHSAGSQALVQTPEMMAEDKAKAEAEAAKKGPVQKAETVKEKAASATAKKTGAAKKKKKKRAGPRALAPAGEGEPAPSSVEPAPQPAETGDVPLLSPPSARQGRNAL